MAEPLDFNLSQTALLIMDYQNMIVEGVAEQYPGLTGRARAVLDAARRAAVPVFYVVVQFRPGYPEISPRNRTFSALKEAGRLQQGTEGAAIHDEVAPRADEPVVVKRRVGAFSATELETLLRAKGCTSLVLMGIATSGVVLSTTRWAADADYALWIVRDCCADADAEVHRVLLDKVLARQARVVHADEIISAFTG